ncbi:MAG TPA: serine hydrolase domain-containing protein [Coleofasciculaceae cyanobacterium]|jgi:CubicO group peptidase (beta-lactamase class C family)
MNRIFHRASLLTLAVLSFIFVSTTGCIQALKGQPATDAASDIPAVTNLVQNGVKRNGLRGAVVLIAKNNRVIYEKAFGDYTVSTVVPTASATKWISASVIMTLVDDGKIALDDPISKYLPNFTGKMGSITLRQLLSHTSGLPGNNRCLANPSITLADCVDRIAQVGLLSDPGTEFRYGGVSYQVAGRVAEVVSGKSWDALFEEKIRTPLNMVNTSYGETNNPRIAGGASSTVEDYANLLQIHLNGGVFNGKRVLSAASVEEMQRDQTGGVPIAFTPQPDNRRYGLGEWLDIVGRNGRSVQLSSQGAFGFSPWIDRERNLLGVFLVRDRLRNVSGLVQDIQQSIRERVD